MSDASMWLSRQILLVENHDQLRKLWELLLKSWGLQVTAVTSAEEALEILNSGAPVDVVFSDIRLPGRLSGLDLAQWLRQHRPAIGIILQTGSDERFPREFRVLLKPVDPLELKACLQELLAKDG
jgi:CheY-like chemotaxis protein